jgi:hypothetical protein
MNARSHGRPDVPSTHLNDPPKRVHTGALKQPARTTLQNEFTWAPSNDPLERFYMGARRTETNRQGRVGQTSCTNVHKANLESQLSIFSYGLIRPGAPSTERLERVHMDALKRPARNDFAWAPEQPKRTDKGESGK